MSAETPEPGEIWQDAEGCLMTRAADGDRWWVFGAAEPIAGDAPGVVYPLARVFDTSGEFVGGRLTYPSGNAFRPAPPEPTAFAVTITREGGEPA